MGDFNSKLEEEVKTAFVSPHGLGERNDRLENFAEDNKLMVLNMDSTLKLYKLYAAQPL